MLVDCVTTGHLAWCCCFEKNIPQPFFKSEDWSVLRVNDGQLRLIWWPPLSSFQRPSLISADNTTDAL